MSFLRLVGVEMRRALHRRVVWVLVALALVGVLVLGLVAFLDSAGKTVAELRFNRTHPAVMADWWIAGTGSGILTIAAVPLMVGGLLGGASVVGGEWRAGTVTTVLTWEPRRMWLHGARLLSAGVLAAVIAAVLQALFLGATVPAVVTHGTTSGTDGAWWASLAAAVGRISLLTAGTAVLGASLATLGRNATFALGVVFGWMAIGENLVRAFKPEWSDWLVGEKVATVLPWTPIVDGGAFGPSPVSALAVLSLYVVLLAAAGLVAFVRRDIAGAG